MRRNSARTGRTNSYGIRRIQRATYSTQNGANTKAGWWELSAAVRKRSGNVCEIPQCKNKAVDVHHIVPLSKGGTNSMANLIHLCEACHTKRHNHLFKKRKP